VHALAQAVILADVSSVEPLSTTTISASGDAALVIAIAMESRHPAMAFARFLVGTITESFI